MNINILEINLRMKRIVAFITCLCLAVIVGCKSDPSRFVLKGTLQPDDSNGKIYLVYEKGGESIYDTATVSGGHFYFEGNIDAPASAYLFDEQQRRLGLYLAPAKMEFVGNLTEPYRFTLTGSQMNDEYMEYMGKVLPLYKKAEALQKERQNAGNVDVQEQMNVLRQEGNKIDRDFLERPASLYGMVLLERNLGNLSLEEIERYFNSYGEEGRNSSLGQKVEAYIQRAKRLQPGQPAPALEATDIDGKPFRLGECRGNYVILDFWASWCVPCRAGNPHLIELWNKYHEKGLEIVCIANDDNSLDQWHKAIEKDGIGMFRHLLRGLKRKGNDYDRSNDLSQEYNVHFLPTKYLIDSDGKIVGKMSTEEITAKLTEVFGF